MNILVAGGAGYIGSVVTAKLIGAGHIVTVLDNLSKGHRAAIHPVARFVEGDIADVTAVTEACRDGIDVAMHFAAFIEVGESVEKPCMYYDNNVVKTVAYLDALRKNDVGRFVFSSTAAVYGEPEQTPLTETATLRPANPYGRSKLMVEQVLGDYSAAYGLSYAALRYFNAGGAYEAYGEAHNPESHLIPRILNALLAGETVKVFGDDYNTRDGSCVRDYIHVSDLADAHLLAAEYLMRDSSSDCFNLGTGDGFSVFEVLSAVERVTGRSLSHEVTPRRPGDTAILVASPDKAKRVLGWSGANMKLDDIIESAWRWKTAHPNGYGDTNV